MITAAVCFQSIGPACKNMATLQRWIGAVSKKLMSSRAGPPASPIASPESERPAPMSATYGESVSDVLATYDPATHSLRTSQACLLPNADGSSTELFLTWPRAGMVRNGRLYRRRKAVRRTSAKGSLLSRGMWPTPKAGDADFGMPRTSGRSIWKVTHLATAVRYWPTPTVNDSKNNAAPSQFNRNSPALNVAVVMYPTPVASGKLNGGTRDFQKLQSLANAGEITEAERRSMSAGNGGQLNPQWVEWLMGFPI